MISDSVKNIVTKVFDRQALDHDEVKLLYTLPSYSPDSYHIQWAAHAILQEASKGQGYIFGQIGLDANPCPGNCVFCSFAACNSPWTDKAELPKDVVVEYARIFNEGGVHLLSLMVSANYDFDQLVDIIAAVRKVIYPKVALMVNMGDFDAPEAEKLKAAGADIVYHAVRVGEGVLTAISPQRRWDTIKAAQGAGLLVASGIEPLYHGSDIDEIAQRSLEVAALPPVFTGVCDLICVEGTQMADCSSITAEEKRIARAACHLTMGRGKTAFGENVRWVDAGANPRMTKMLVGEDRIKQDIERAKADLIANEWRIAERDAAVWEVYNNGN